MIRKVISVMLVCVLMLSCTAWAAAGTTTNSEDYIPSETIETVSLEPQIEYVEVPVEIEVPIELIGNPLIYVETENRAELKELMAECEQRKNDAHDMAEAARACGYAEDHPVILLAKDEWKNADELYKIYKEKCNGLIKAEAWEEYPVATECWVYLKDLGYNDYVCAGIIGNMMAEVGGGTLDLQWWLGNSFYGLCQWSTYYRPEAKGLDVPAQLDLLRDTIKAEIDYAGFIYKSGFNYEQFLELEDEREAALAFAMAYERCAKQHYWCRADYAEIAYNYFVG